MARPHQPHPVLAFTLIELMLVMAVVTITISIAAPALANFFRGRSLDSEARRLLAMTRDGQSRAVSEGVPIELWIDAARNAVGMEAEPSYESADARAVEFTLDSNVEIAVLNAATTSSARTSLTSFSSSTGSRVNSRHADLPRIRFLPDGSCAETSPQALRLTGRDGISLVLAQSRNGLSYELRASTGNY